MKKLYLDNLPELLGFSPHFHGLILGYQQEGLIKENY